MAGRDCQSNNNRKHHYRRSDFGSWKKPRQQLPLECEKAKWPVEIQLHPNLKAYWNNRYNLFSKYDEGIQLDAESWYSVTPEKISERISDHCSCDTIIDAFCGVGGNTIQFAKTCKRVIAIDIDPKKIQMARHNATIYRVADRIEFVVGDFFELAPTLVADVVFLSPPWGGPKYKLQKSFPLENIMEPYGGKCLYETAKMISSIVAYYLPRNINEHEVYNLVSSQDYVNIEQQYLGTKLIAVMAYFNKVTKCK